LTLPELQQLAMANNPVIRQRAADVKSAEGALRQAGAYPNPTFGYESDTAGTGNTAGYQGGFLEQLIKTAGKLKLAQARAAMDLFNAQVALRAAQSDVMTQVRTGYFGLLVAERSLRWSWDLAEFTERVYRISVENAVQGLLAGYEPMSLRGLAMTSLGVLAQAQTRYLAAWEQLAASLGLPELPLTEVAGDSEMPPPHFDQQAGLARVLAGHTDILTARNGQQRARYDLAIAQRTPVPDVDFRLAVQKDYTMPPFSIVYSVQAGMQIPIWDQNRGNIVQAQGALLRATEEEHRARADLASRYADAFSRFEANRRLVDYYRTSILPDASRVYTRTLLRFNTQLQSAEDKVAFVDIVTYQQFYVTSLANYIAALHDMWQAAADLGGLLQSVDLFLGTDIPCPGPTDPAQLLPLPCSHPCNPLAGAPSAAPPSPPRVVAGPSLPVQQLPPPAAPR
jgi:cobalt-zinc-cadmium efflux system outer membrane protein